MLFSFRACSRYVHTEGRRKQESAQQSFFMFEEDCCRKSGRGGIFCSEGTSIPCLYRHCIYFHRCSWHGSGLVSSLQPDRKYVFWLTCRNTLMDISFKLRQGVLVASLSFVPALLRVCSPTFVHGTPQHQALLGDAGAGEVK